LNFLTWWFFKSVKKRTNEKNKRNWVVYISKNRKNLFIFTLINYEKMLVKKAFRFYQSLKKTQLFLLFFIYVSLLICLIISEFKLNLYSNRHVNLNEKISFIWKYYHQLKEKFVQIIPFNGKLLKITLNTLSLNIYFKLSLFFCKIS